MKHNLRKLAILGTLAVCCSNCSTPEPDQPERLQKEIIAVEKAFMDQLNAQSPAEAFGNFAADQAVIKRENDTLILGKANIIHYYQQPIYHNAKAFWKPDYVSVALGGDMAYTFGRYRWEFRDSLGQLTEWKGVFHTVWEKQADGQWRFVWD